MNQKTMAYTSASQLCQPLDFKKNTVAREEKVLTILIMKHITTMLLNPQNSPPTSICNNTCHSLLYSQSIYPYLVIWQEAEDAPFIGSPLNVDASHVQILISDKLHCQISGPHGTLI